MICYKLFRLRADGTVGPLFIDRRKVIEPGVWYQAQSIPTKGYALRPGWHTLAQPVAPHLSKRGRVWAVVEINGYVTFRRPEAQGGVWYLSEWMRLIRLLEDNPHE